MTAVESSREEGDDATFASNRHHDTTSKGLVTTGPQYPEGDESFAQEPTGLEFTARDPQTERPVRQSDFKGARE